MEFSFEEIMEIIKEEIKTIPYGEDEEIIRIVKSEIVFCTFGDLLGIFYPEILEEGTIQPVFLKWNPRSKTYSGIGKIENIKFREKTIIKFLEKNATKKEVDRNCNPMFKDYHLPWKFQNKLKFNKNGEDSK